MVKSFQHKRCRCNWILWSQQLPVWKQLSAGFKRHKQEGKVQLEERIFISQLEKREIFFHFSCRAFGNPIHTDVKGQFKPDCTALRREHHAMIWVGVRAVREPEAGFQLSMSPTGQQDVCRLCDFHLASVYPIRHYVCIPPLSGLSFRFPYE